MIKTMTEILAEKLAKVQDEIAETARKAGRNPSEITLVAVSKTHPSKTVHEGINCGLTVFGENKIQEAEEKIAEIGREKAEWHLIGHLQSNKARKAAKIFDVIHTIDSIELAERLERICIEENIAEISVFAQIDLAGEVTKSGVSEKDLSSLSEFLKNCKRLKFIGLMTIPPFFEDAEKVRPYFRKLRELRDNFLPEGKLSMGMSHDFAVAIEEGATHIRIGTAIFGERNYQK